MEKKVRSISMNKTDSDTSTLTSLSINRILIDMIEDSRNKGGQEAILLLVVDSNTVKIISSCLKMTDILGVGVISIEKLELARAKLPNFQAIYFVSPIKESVDHIIKDFSNDSSPQYSKLHVFFSSACPQELLEELVTPSIVKRMLTCKQFNLAYLLKDHNVFDLGYKKALQIFPVKDIPVAKNRIINTAATRLLTILATLKERPFVQYQKNSWICKTLAEEVDKQAEELYKQKVPNENRGILLIMDRTIDKSFPFLYDYSYISVINDVLKLKNKTLTIDSKENKQINHILDNNDNLWDNYKYNHIVPTIKSIQSELEAFSKSESSKIMSSGMDNTQDISKAIRGMKEYQSMSSLFNYHLKIADRFQKEFPSMKLAEIIDLQQEIVTGLDKDFNKVKTRDTLKQIGLVIKDFPEEVIKRIIPLIPINMEISEQNLRIIIDNKLNDVLIQSILNLKWLGVNFSGINSNFEKEHAPSDAQLEKLKNRPSYRDIKCESRIASFSEQCSEGKLSKSEFSFIEEPEKSLYKKSSSKNEDDKPYLIVFVFGGILESEIAAIYRQYSNSGFNGFKLVVGGTGVFNSEEFFENLGELPSGKTDNFEITGLNEFH